MTDMPEKLKDSIIKTKGWLASVCYELNTSCKPDNMISYYRDLIKSGGASNRELLHRFLAILNCLDTNLFGYLLDVSRSLNPNKHINGNTVFIKVSDQYKIYLTNEQLVEYMENNYDNLMKELANQAIIAFELIPKKYCIGESNIYNSSKLYKMFDNGKLLISNLEKYIIDFLTANNNIHFMRKENKNIGNFAYDLSVLDRGLFGVHMEHVFYYLIYNNNMSDFKCLIQLQMYVDSYYYHHYSFIYYFLIEGKAIESAPAFRKIRKRVSRFVSEQILDKLAKYGGQ